MDETKQRIAQCLASVPRTACDLSRMLSTPRLDVMQAIGEMQQHGCVEMAPPVRAREHFRFKLTDAGRVRYVHG